MSKTKQFCETSSIFQVVSIRNETILRDVLPKWKRTAELTASCQYVLWFFHSICLKYCAYHEKWGQVIRRAAPVTQNNLSKRDGSMYQNVTPLRNSAPWPPNICACHVKCIFADPLQMSHACQRFWICGKTSRFAHIWRSAETLAPATRKHIRKSGPRPPVSYTFDFEMCFAP